MRSRIASSHSAWYSSSVEAAVAVGVELGELGLPRLVDLGLGQRAVLIGVERLEQALAGPPPP